MRPAAMIVGPTIYPHVSNSQSVCLPSLAEQNRSVAGEATVSYATESPYAARDGGADSS